MVLFVSVLALAFIVSISNPIVLAGLVIAAVAISLFGGYSMAKDMWNQRETVKLAKIILEAYKDEFESNQPGTDCPKNIETLYKVVFCLFASL